MIRCCDIAIIVLLGSVLVAHQIVSKDGCQARV